MTRLFLEILNTCTQIFVKLQQDSYSSTLKINMNRFSKFCKESIPVFGCFVLIIFMAVIVAWLTFRLVNKISLDGSDQILVANLVEEIFCLVVLWTFVAIGLSFSGLVIFLNLRDNLTTTMITINPSGDQENPHCLSRRVLDEVWTF